MTLENSMRLFALLLTLLPLAAHAQSGTAFTYQGRLDDNGVAVNVNHDFQFRLCGDAACTSGGTLVQRDAVQVRTGVFTTTIDFGAAFAGQSAFLEIATRRSGSGNPFQLLLPCWPARREAHLSSDAASTAERAKCWHVAGRAQIPIAMADGDVVFAPAGVERVGPPRGRRRGPGRPGPAAGRGRHRRH